MLEGRTCGEDGRLMARQQNKQRTRTQPQPAPAPASATSAEIGPRGKWTAAGAARLVREARIATARYMRDAETGQLWEMTRLAEAYTVWLEHLRAQVAELSPQPDDDTVRGTAWRCCSAARV